MEFIIIVTMWGIVKIAEKLAGEEFMKSINNK